jgi:hypothetical protein
MSSTFYANAVKGDGVTAFVNAQAVIPLRLKNMTDWFGAIGTSDSSHFVTIPYQASTLYAICLTANQNGGRSRTYRKSRLDYVEKCNDFATSAMSFLVQTTAVQGAAHNNPTLTLSVTFNAAGGPTKIASSDSGQLAVSWPSSYSFESIDVQVIQSG